MKYQAQGFAMTVTLDATEGIKTSETETLLRNT